MSSIASGIVDTKNLDITVNPERDIINVAADKAVSEPVKEFVSKIVEDNLAKLSNIWDELVHYDYMFRCGLSAEQKAVNTPMVTPEEAKANVGATMFFRQVMQSAAKTYSLQTSRDALWKYTPVYTKGVPYSREDAAQQCEMLNTLVQWGLAEDKFDPKLITIDMMIAKYGMCFVGVNWRRSTGVRKVKIPASLDKDGKIVKGAPKFIELDTIYENRPEVVIFDPFSVIVDPNIDSIQAQDCVAVTRLVTFGEAIELVEGGYWDAEQFKRITASQGWDGVAGRPKASDQATNAGLQATTSDKTSMLLTWETWANLPIDENGTLDQKTVIPARYHCTFVGNSISDSVCVRIERNDDPDDEIPLEIIHDYPDDPAKLFHISKGAVLKNNFAVEVTAVNQMIDGTSLVLSPPTIEKKGCVLTTNRTYGRSSRIIVRDSVNEDIREYSVPDRTQTGIALLEYVKADSKMAIHTDPAQMGEGLGSRASATESSGVMRLSAAPSVMNAKYITSQLFTYLAKKLKSMWQEFSLPEQVIQITDTDSSIQTIMPAEIFGEFDVKIDVVEKVMDDMMAEQKAAQDIQAFSANPELLKVIDIEGLMNEYFVRRYGKSYVKDSSDADAITVARKDIELIRSGVVANAEQGQNHKVHLDILRAERIRYRGVEDKFPFVIALDRLIEQHEQMSGSETKAPKGQAVPQPEGVSAEGGTPANPTAGVPAAQPAVAGGGAANMRPPVGMPR